MKNGCQQKEPATETDSKERYFTVTQEDKTVKFCQEGDLSNVVIESNCSIPLSETL
jgi:hypothetical protein